MPGRTAGGTLPAPVPSRTRPRAPRASDARSRPSSEPAARTCRSTAVTSRRGRRTGPRTGGRVEADAAAVQHADRPEAAAEGVQPLRVPLADAGGRVDLLADDDEGAATAGVGVGGGADGRGQVRRPVPAGVGERAHRPAEHDGLRARDREVEEVRGLLEGVGAVGDHDAVHGGVGEDAARRGGGGATSTPGSRAAPAGGPGPRGGGGPRAEGPGRAPRSRGRRARAGPPR